MPDRKLQLAVTLAGTAAGFYLASRRSVPSGPPTGLGADGRPGLAMITGGSAGIGATFARQLAALGYDLFLVARRADRLEAMAAELTSRHGITVETMTADLSLPADVDRLVERVAAFPDLALLVNNAGFGTTGSFARTDFQRQLEMIEVHVLAAVRLSRAALPGMLARHRGGIINLASVAAFVPVPGGVTYSASKAYLVMFSQALQNELTGRGVQIQALCPGFTHSEFHDTPDFSGDPRSAIPEWLWGSADEVVTASLSALARGEVICVPGFKNQVAALLARTPPTGALLQFAIRRAMPGRRQKPQPQAT